MQSNIVRLDGRECEIIDIGTLRPVQKKAPRTTPVKTQTAVVIKDKEVLEQIKEKLLYSSEKYGIRNYVIFVFGINCGLRCGDLLQIRLQDLWDFNKNCLLPKMTILEEKTRKVRTISFSETIAETLTDYIRSMEDISPYTPLFPSQKKGEKTQNGVKDNTGCLSRKSYWEILHQIGQTLGIEHLGTHSLRKVFGYNIMIRYKGQLIGGEFSALDVLQQIYGHSSSAVTLRYTGITEEIHDDIYKNLNL